MILLRFTIAFLLSLLLFSTLGRADFKDRPYEPVVYPQIVQILFGGAHCTGSVVDQDTVLTAAHCIPDRDVPISVQFIDGRLEEATPISVGKSGTSKDAAFLKVKTKDIKPFKIKKRLLQMGEELYYISMRDTQHKKLDIQVSGYDIDNFGLIMLYSGITWGGDSGSPILDKDGYVVGLVFASYSGEPLGAAVLANNFPSR